jgi:tetratricopeptide (TPR) repeat protein
MDRGAVYHTLGRYHDAIADWTQAINAADAEPRQRFRTLEARAQTLEKLGKFSASADDYEAMARFSDIAPRYRDELKRQVAHLRARQHND